MTSSTSTPPKERPSCAWLGKSTDIGDFESAGSSPRGGGWAPGSEASPPGSAKLPSAARRALRRRGGRARALPGGRLSRVRRRVAERVDRVHVARGHVEAVALHVQHERRERDERRQEEEEAPPVHHVHVQRHARAEVVEAFEWRRERVELAVPVLGEEGVGVLARLLDVGLRVHRAQILGQHDRMLHRAPTGGAKKEAVESGTFGWAPARHRIALRLPSGEGSRLRPRE